MEEVTSFEEVLIPETKQKVMKRFLGRAYREFVEFKKEFKFDDQNQELRY